MSSQPPSNENLSAYFDHEVAPEERRELESLLDHSAAAQQELHEFGEISRLLQETATESAPPELAASIRRRIEQETLLTEPTPATVKRAPSMLRYRIAVAISACSSVAALVLFILLMNIPDPAQQFANADRFAYRTPTESQQETILFSQDKTPADEYHGTLSKSAASSKQGKATITAAAPSVAFRSAALPVTELDQKEGLVMSAPEARKMKGNFSITNSVAENKVAASFPPPNMPFEPRPASGIPSHVPVDAIRIGDAFPYFSEINGKVVVIEVRVVDVKQALGTMELLLARNNIPVNQQKQSDVERQLQHSHKLKIKAEGQDNQSKPKVDDSENELFAVYVEATDTQLASALQEFQKDLKRDQLIGLTLQPAINELSLTEAVEDLPRLLASQQQSANTAMEKGEAKKVTEWALNDHFTAGKPQAKSARAKQSIAADAKQKSFDVPSKEQRSYQTRYRMQLPAEQLGQKARVVQRNVPRASVTSEPKASAKDRRPLVASKPGLNTDTRLQYLGATPVSNSPVKVLFVFKGAAAPATVPAPN
ncbi:hypothetical protein [uncultured Gimesia sp.]|uniref:anti-sigma factor family protein n=1 Tax=uncultured Gimesia sp. TaxID=1678688 RepID=UPI0030DD56BA|tara:strand:+ start:149714 stop:151336 length:1623 start_codon:yes stop_codon:yes gene_type:complete